MKNGDKNKSIAFTEYVNVIFRKHKYNTFKYYIIHFKDFKVSSSPKQQASFNYSSFGKHHMRFLHYEAANMQIYENKAAEKSE